MNTSLRLPVLYRIEWFIGQNRFRFSFWLSTIACLFSGALLAGCERPAPDASDQRAITVAPREGGTAVIERAPDVKESPPILSILPTPTLKEIYVGTPTPDPTQEPGDAAQNYHTHTVAFGETLAYIASLYKTTIEELLEINGIEDEDFLAVGQPLQVPGEEIGTTPSQKLIPDSELVYGPAAIDFSVDSFVQSRGGYLSLFVEEVEGKELTGPQIVQLVADRFSVNPRLLLAVLEHRSRWLTLANPGDDGYPMGYMEEDYEGLYQQLSWAANKLNLGYYGRSEGGINYIDVGDKGRFRFASDINDGTAGLQLYYASYPETSVRQWLQDIGPNGILETYSGLFGNPFNYAVDPLWPSEMKQPRLLLPFERGDTWFFSGGPHGGWASGSAWAALDFSPSDDQPFCEMSEKWVAAVADGVIARSSFGAAVLDLDGDGYPGTGWTITYMHIADEDRIPAGTLVSAGDLIGHPSCEGGFSNATHLHIARSFNGRWVSADGNIPFDLNGWISEGLGREYDGLLIRGDDVKEACQCEEEGNAITGE